MVKFYGPKGSKYQMIIKILGVCMHLYVCAYVFECCVEEEEGGGMSNCVCIYCDFCVLVTISSMTFNKLVSN